MNDSRMAKLNQTIEEAVDDLGKESGQSPYAKRALQVQSRFKAVIERIYKDKSPAILLHVNAVYITTKAEAKVLIVYVDQSIFSAELNAQREMVKLLLLEMFGEDIDAFEIYTSRAAYKERRPYDDDGEETLQTPVQKPLPKLDKEEEEHIESVVGRIEDERVRNAAKKAMTADLQRKKEEI